MQKNNYEPLSYSELSEEEKQIVNQYIKELDTKNIEGIQTITDIETKKLYKEQQILAGIQTKFNIELTNLSDNDDKLNEDKGFEFFKQFFLTLKKKLQRFISKENDEESFNINRIKDEFIDIKLELKLRSTKLRIMEENLRNHYVDIGYIIIALQELDGILRLNTDNGAISNDYEKRDLDIKRKKQINNTISYLRGIRINIANAIIISESLVQQYEKLSENYDDNKVLSLLQCMDEDGIIGNKDFIKDTQEMISIRFARFEKRINKLYLASESLYNISASRKTGFIELKQLKERLYKEYDNIIKTAKYDEYPKLENDIIIELAQIEHNVEEYVYDTRKHAEEIIVCKIKKIYNSSNYKDFQNMDTEIKNVEAIEELLNYYNSYLEADLKKELKTQVITLKFNLYYRKQVELLIYGNEKNECIFVEDNLSEQEKICFNHLLKQKIEALKEQYIKSDNSKDEELFNTSVSQILYDKVLLERVIIMDLKYHPYDYITLLKAKIFNAHLCNIANNPFEPEIYIKTQSFGCDFGEFKNFKANKVNYSMLVAVLKNIITDENVSIIECDNLYRRFGFRCNPIMSDTGKDCIKAIFEQVKWTTEYFDLAKSVIMMKNKTKLEMPYFKIKLIPFLYYFEDEYEDSYTGKSLTKHIDNVISLTEKRITRLKDIRRQYGDIYFYFEYKCMWPSYKELDADLKREQISLNWLKGIKEKQSRLDSKDTRRLLEIINMAYKKSNIRYKCREIQPLENMIEDMTPFDSDQVFLVKIPRNRTNGYCLELLWGKYQKDFEDLGIDVILSNYYYEYSLEIPIYVNLNDILELPIDYNKVNFINEEELKKLMKRKGEKEIPKIEPSNKESEKENAFSVHPIRAIKPKWSRALFSRRRNPELRNYQGSDR